MTQIALESLMEVQTVESAMEWNLSKLQAAEIDVTAWTTGIDSPWVFMYVSSVALADRTRITAAQARGGYIPTAEEDWLTLLADSHYDNQRYDPTRAAGEFVLTPDSTAGLPISKAAGDVIVVNQATGYTYRNTAGFTLSTAGTGVPVAFQAEVAGSSRKIASNITTLKLQTAIPGVTVTNPPIVDSNSWATNQGSDEETDAALKTRCTTKWASLAQGTGPRDAYEYWARTADPAVDRVQIDDQDATGTGNVVVYLADNSGAPDDSVVDNVRNYINGNSGLGIKPRRPLGATVTIQKASESVLPLAVIVYVNSTYGTDGVAEAAKAAIEAYINTVPIGGTKLNALDLSGFVLLSQVWKAVADAVPGVVNLETFPSSNVSVGKGVVVTPDVVVSSVVPV